MKFRSLEIYIIEEIIKNSKYERAAKRYIKLLESYDDEKYKNESQEWHHILARSLFPQYVDDSNNMIRISTRFHFILHKILVRVFDTQEMWCALHFMSFNRRYETKMTSKMYAELRKRNLEIVSKTWSKSNSGTVPVRDLRDNSTKRIPCKEYYDNLDKYESNSLRLVKEGTHYFQTLEYESNPSVISSREGRHRFQDYENNPSVISSKNKTHRWLDYNNHPSVIAVRENCHHWQGLEPWKHPAATARSLFTWYVADKIYKMHLKYPHDGYVLLFRKILKEVNDNISNESLRKMLRYFKEKSWIPVEDLSWLKFKDTYNPEGD